MDLACEAGRILLENGAEISRVEETMRRIATHYGVSDDSFFVLSNGFIATADSYAYAKFIPIKGTSLDRVVAVNQLSREVEQGQHDLDSLASQLAAIRRASSKPVWEQVLGSAVGSGAFCIVFGGSLSDSLASFVAGALLWLFVLFVGVPHLSRIVCNVCGGLLASLLSIVLFRLGFGEHVGNMVVGSIIPLIPGVPFTNGVRDLANEDYIAGVTRLLDALLVFVCIALGVALAFVVDGALAGSIIELNGMQTDGFTSAWLIQLAAAFLGTAAFAILFGVPRRYYADCGLCGLVGWALFLFLFRAGWLTTVGATFFGAVLVALTARLQSVVRRCPVTVFLVCGIFPLVPGAGIFWTSYHVVSNHLALATSTGFVAFKATVAIALGIIVANEFSRLFVRRKRRLSSNPT